jgi:hypothetical protein
MEEKVPSAKAGIVSNPPNFHAQIEYPKHFNAQM